MGRRSHRAILAALAVGALLLSSVAPVQAASFNWDQSAGFEFGTATTGGIQGASTAFGGIEFFNPTVFDANVPLTYTIIGWGCTPGVTAGTAAAQCASGVGGVNVNTLAATDPTTLSNRSTLEVIALNSPPQLVSGGPAVDITQLIHRNSVIDINSRVLSSVEIRSQLVIDPGGADELSDPTTLTLGFLETHNVADCAETVNPLDSNCDDRFSFTTIDFTPLAFSSNGVNYEIIFGLRAPCDNVVDQVGTVTVYECVGVRLGIDFLNGEVFAQEGATSSIFVTMQLIELAVPAPAALLLLGSGLIGTAVVTRIRRKK